MTERLNKFLQALQRIQEQKDILEYDGLEKILQLHQDLFDNAANAMALYPYLQGVKSTLESLRSVREMLTLAMDMNERSPAAGMKMAGGLALVHFGSSLFGLAVNKDEFAKAQMLVHDYMRRLENLQYVYTIMDQKIRETVQIEIPVNFAREGKLLVPSGRQMYLFNFRLERGSGCEHHHLVTDQEKMYSSRAEAWSMLQPRVPPLIEAKNTEPYPLYETSLPLIREKYEQACWVKYTAN